MNFIRTEIPDVVVCEPKLLGDDRGYFMETFRADKLNDFLDRKIDFCQDNQSKSSYGVLRGLHYQLPPFSQSKLVRVLEGKVLDVAVDIRRGSPTFGKSVAVELTAENHKQLFVPRGFAHGFLVLSDIAVFAYKCDNYYAPEFDRGIRHDDKELDIDWPLSQSNIILSAKDSNFPSFSEAEKFDFANSLYE